MKLYAKSLLRGLAAGSFIAVVVAVTPTFLDWRQNPGGIFRSSDGTNWGVVFETLTSWLWPAFLVAVPVAILVFALVSKRKSHGSA